MLDYQRFQAGFRQILCLLLLVLASGQLHSTEPTKPDSTALACSGNATATPATLCVGGSSTLSISPNGGNAPYAYTWSNSLGNTASVVATPAVTTTYTVTVTDAGSCNLVRTVTVTVSADPSITTQPTNTGYCTGGSATFTVVSTGGTPSLTHQWQYLNGAVWGNVANGTPASSTYSGGTTTTLTISGNMAANTYSYRVLVNASGTGCNQVVSNTVTNTVAAPQSITAQPTGGTICLGGSQTLTVTATGGAPTLNYQWQYSNGASWSNVANGTPTGASYSGGTSASMTVSGMSVAATYPYRVLLTATGTNCTQVTSSTANVIAVADPSFTTQPTGSTIAAGGTASMTVAATGGTPSLSYAWQYYNGTTWSNVANGTPTGSTYSGSATTTLSAAGISATGTYQYRALASATGNGCDVASSNTASIVVVADPSISSQPSNATICTTGTSSFSVTATGGTPSLTYQWQYYNGVTWGNVANGTPTGAAYTNATTATMSVASISATGTYSYRVLVNCSGSGCDQATSSTATLTVNSSASITTQPTGATSCANTSQTMSVVTSGGTSLSYQWQYNSGSWGNVTAGTPTGATYSGGTTSSLTVSGVSTAGTYQYRVLITDSGSGCASVTSNTASQIILAAPTGSAGADQTQCNNAVFTMAGSNSGGSTGTWTVISGTASIANVNSATTTVTASTTNVTLLWTVTLGSCSITDQVDLTYNTLTMTASNDGPNCPGSMLQLKSTPAGLASYVWSGPSSYSSSIQSPTITSTTSSNSGTYTVTGTDSTGCSTSASTTVTIYSAPAQPGTIGY